jgi:sulfofructose kinase
MTGSSSSPGRVSGSPKIVGLGFCCLDELLLLTEIPPPEGRAVIRQRERQGGGMVATAMVATARLGGDVGFIAAVGDDTRGTRILDEFRHYGVDVSQCVTRPGAISHETIVMVDERTGARSFLSERGNAAPLTPADLPRDYLSHTRYLHLSDASDAALTAAEWVHAGGGEVCFDGTHFHPSLWPVLKEVDYLIVSRFFAAEFAAHKAGKGLGSAAAQFADLAPKPSADPHPETLHMAPEDGSAHVAPALTGEALLDVARALRDEGPRVVVVTEGEHGSWCASPEGEFHTPAFEPPRVVDTTGAGDVFHGAFLFGRAQGWDLRRSLKVAAATASLKCRALGGRAGIPTLPEALELALS